MTSKELQNKLSSRFNFEDWKSVLTEMFPRVEFFTRINQVYHDLIKSGGQIGLIRLDDGRSLAIYIFEVEDNVLINRNRKGLRDIAAKTIDQSVIHGALAFYYSKNVLDYRLTFIAKQTSFNESGELIKTETAPKRYTFLLGENESCRTAADRLYELVSKKKNNSIYLADVTDAFSVERLNKEFFTGYKAQYIKFLKQLSDTKQNRDYVKKLLGRLVFLQFLQKKGWMGVPASHSKWEGGDKNYLSHLIERYEGNNRLLSDVLEVLFFNTLNVKREGDIADVRLGKNIKIPYLNGGLFEKDNIDKLDIDFPYSYFKELLDFFAMYNFTIDENDPDDSEVGIDPEMLGHIFENLLEDNKDKGAYYTPKEVVQYMCAESIALYLKSHTKESLHRAIDELIKEHTVAEILQNRATSNKLYKLLEDIKVCDPAIGSGAFPIGVLNILYHTRLLLYGFTNMHQTFSHAEVKRSIIQNNIYGIDIEQGAVDIARLRFWLALVVDEDDPQPLPNLDYKIVCGNSLLNRFDLEVPLNNVFVEYNKDKTKEEKMNLIVYKQLVADYTNTSDHSKKKAFRKVIDEIKKAFRSELTKQDKKRIADVRGSIASKEVPLLFGGLNKKEKAELKKLRKKLDILEQERTYILNNQLYKDAFEWRFEFPTLLDENGNFKGFDLIIGNPPYQRIQGIREVNSAFADELVRKYKSATGSFDLYVTFAERGLSLINENGIVNYIMPTKWTNAAFGKGLRELVSKQCAAYKIINFGAYQVFNASTYTGLQWLKRNSTDLKYYELDRDLSTNRELDLYLKSLNAFNEAQISSYKLSKDSWVLTIGEVSKILNILEQQPRRVSDIFEKIFQGLATGKDDVYFLYDCVDENENVSGYSKQLRQFVKIERGLVKPLLKGEDVHRYEHIVTNRFVIFPYKIENGKAILYSEQELANSFPLGYAYLKQSEDVLRKREKGRFNIDGEWFQYSRKQGILFAEFEKLVAPDISVGGNFAYDAQGLFYQTTTVYGYIKKKEVKEDYKFWMALFNSRLFWWYLKNTGTVLANGFFRFKPDYIKPFPIPKAISSEANKIISTLCDYILTIKSQNFNISELLSNKLISEYFEKIIDGCIYEIYFGDYMKKLEIDIISSALTLIKSISNLSSDKERIEVILHTFLTIKKTDNPIRKRLELFTLRSPELLKVIIEG